MKPCKPLLIAATLAFASTAALAQMDHSRHGAPAAATSDSASTQAYQHVNDRMHQGMDIEFTGNADIDFARGMIPHHQGAIDMAKVVLEYGKDPEIRKLAKEIVAAQESEIAFLQEWLQKHSKHH